MNDDPRLGIGNRIRDKPVFVHRRYAGQPDHRLRHVMLILGIELKFEVSAITNHLVGRVVPSAPQRSPVDTAKFQHLLIPSHHCRKIRQLLVACNCHRNLELRHRIDLAIQCRQVHRRRHPRMDVLQQYRAGRICRVHDKPVAIGRDNVRERHHRRKVRHHALGILRRKLQHEVAARRLHAGRRGLQPRRCPVTTAEFQQRFIKRHIRHEVRQRLRTGDRHRQLELGLRLYRRVGNVHAHNGRDNRMRVADLDLGALRQIKHHRTPVTRLHRRRRDRHRCLSDVMHGLHVKHQPPEPPRSRPNLATRSGNLPIPPFTFTFHLHLAEGHAFGQPRRLHRHRRQHRRIILERHREAVRRNAHRVVHRDDHLDVRVGERTRVIEPHARTELHVHRIRWHGLVNRRRRVAGDVEAAHARNAIPVVLQHARNVTVARQRRLVRDPQITLGIRRTVHVVSANARLRVRIPLQEHVVRARIRPHVRRTSRLRISEEHQFPFLRAQHDIVIAVILPVDERNRDSLREPGTRTGPDLVLERKELFRLNRACRRVAIQPDVSDAIRDQDIRAAVRIDVRARHRHAVNDRRIENHRIPGVRTDECPRLRQHDEPSVEHRRNAREPRIHDRAVRQRKLVNGPAVIRHVEDAVRTADDWTCHVRDQPREVRPGIRLHGNLREIGIGRRALVDKHAQLPLRGDNEIEEPVSIDVDGQRGRIFREGRALSLIPRQRRGEELGVIAVDNRAAHLLERLKVNLQLLAERIAHAGELIRVGEERIRPVDALFRQRKAVAVRVGVRTHARIAIPVNRLLFGSILPDDRHDLRVPRRHGEGDGIPRPAELVRLPCAVQIPAGKARRLFVACRRRHRDARTNVQLLRREQRPLRFRPDDAVKELKALHGTQDAALPGIRE